MLQILMHHDNSLPSGGKAVSYKPEDMNENMKIREILLKILTNVEFS